MGETKLTKTLKMAAMLFLKNHLCDEIAPEVKIYPARTLLNNNRMDRHYTIDVCGVGVKYRHSQNPRESMIKEPILSARARAATLQMLRWAREQLA